MSTLGLIDQALQDQTAVTIAVAALADAVDKKDTADRNASASALALFNDLTSGGRAVVVDTTQTPPVVTEYTPVAPASFAATIIRVAT